MSIDYRGTLLAIEVVIGGMAVVDEPLSIASRLATSVQGGDSIRRAIGSRCLRRC